MTPALSIARFGARWYELLTEASNATNAERVGSLARLAAEQHETEVWRAFRGVHAAIDGKPNPGPDMWERLNLAWLMCPGCEACRWAAAA